MIQVGTCGFSYKGWVGPFLPRGHSGSGNARILRHQIRSAGVGLQCYSMPVRRTIAGMCERTPEGLHVLRQGAKSMTRDQ